jgi:hypothetical protein
MNFLDLAAEHRGHGTKASRITPPGAGRPNDGGSETLHTMHPPQWNVRVAQHYLSGVINAYRVKCQAGAEVTSEQFAKPFE